MSDNSNLEQQILKALQKHQAAKLHKARLIFSIIAGLFVTIILSKCQLFSPFRQNTKQYYTFKTPMSFCGDKSAGGTGTWYPVYVDDSADNLIQIRKFYCCDAAYERSVNKILVASFYNRSKAEQFVAILKNKNFPSAYLGSGRRITTSPTSSQDNCL
ncbi:hypothetical protein [Aerosakkonema funiforme]|uniref:hypothetical protein n=1 Tax=Aerosakkonema funiforme TaxID=1246630 RepID=UPI0035B72306